MKDDVKTLKFVLSSISKLEVITGIPVTDEEIAKSTGISLEQMLSYVNGDTPIPNGYVARLANSFGIEYSVISHTIKKVVHFRKSD